MNTKYGYRILIAIMALGLAAAGIVLSFLPDIVPAHYNFAGEADRMGSKLEYLVFPISAAVMGGVFALAARHGGKKGAKESALTEKILLWTAFFEVLLFNGLGLFFMWRAAVYRPGDTLTEAPPAADIMKLADILLGLLLILLGNVMPKATRNNFFGLRTKWSLADDEVWRKSQRFGGFSAVALGFFLLVTAAFMSGEAHFILLSAAVLVWLGVSVGASYQFSRQRS